MSEYQFVAFRAVDRPVSDQNMEYMAVQSSRAEISPWSFRNEYDYGDFHGNAVEMLRRGYDIHLHYASFGTRRLLIRLPQGLPDPRVFRLYACKDSIQFIKDKQGEGGSLDVDPYYESTQLPQFREIQALFDRMVPLRREILDGDLRPLYLVHLAVACDDAHDPEETREAPVPAGLCSLTDAQSALAEFYGLSAEYLAAAARESPPIPDRGDASGHARWIRDQSSAVKDAWLIALMDDPGSSVTSEMLAKYRADIGQPVWPTVRPNRMVSVLLDAEKEAIEHAKRLKAEEVARLRAERLAKLAADPDAVQRQIETFVALRTTRAYKQVADLLAEFREALVGSQQFDLAEQQAQGLKSAHPKLRSLENELRRQGFLQ